MQCHQRRRTGRVHGKRRPLEPQDVGDAPDRRVQRRTAGGIEAGGRFRQRGIFPNQLPVVVVANPAIDGRAGAAQGFGVQARILQGVPGRLQHHALLGIDELRLDRRDSEELRVELINAVHESKVPARGQFGVAVREENVESFVRPVGIQIGHGMDAVVQQTRKGSKAVGSRELASHTHNRNGRGRARPAGTLRLGLLPVPGGRHRRLGRSGQVRQGSAYGEKRSRQPCTHRAAPAGENESFPAGSRSRRSRCHRSRRQAGRQRATWGRRQSP